MMSVNELFLSNHWIVDSLLLFLTLTACFCCIVLSRRVKALQDHATGLSASAASLTDSIGKTHEAARETQSEARQAVDLLRFLIEKCETSGAELETLIAETEVKLTEARQVKLDLTETVVPGAKDAVKHAKETAATLIQFVKIAEKRYQAQECETRVAPSRSAAAVPMLRPVS